MYLLSRCEIMQGADFGLQLAFDLETFVTDFAVQWNVLVFLEVPELCFPPGRFAGGFQHRTLFRTLPAGHLR